VSELNTGGKMVVEEWSGHSRTKKSKGLDCWTHAM